MNFEFFYPRCWAEHLPLLNSSKSLLALFSSLPRFPWTCPATLSVWYHLQSSWECTVLPTRSFPKMLKGPDPAAIPKGCHGQWSLLFCNGKIFWGRDCFLFLLVSHWAVTQTLRFNPASHSISSPACFFGGKLKCTALILHMKRGFCFLYITKGQCAETFLILHVSKRYSCKFQTSSVYCRVAQCVPSVAHSLDDIRLWDHNLMILGRTQ